MKNILPLVLLAFLLLSGCGGSENDGSGGSLESMFEGGSDEGSEDEVSDEEVPYSEGPTNIPSDLLPND